MEDTVDIYVCNPLNFQNQIWSQDTAETLVASLLGMYQHLRYCICLRVGEETNFELVLLLYPVFHPHSLCLLGKRLTFSNLIVRKTSV